VRALLLSASHDFVKSVLLASQSLRVLIFMVLKLSLNLFVSFALDSRFLRSTILLVQEVVAISAEDLLKLGVVLNFLLRLLHLKLLELFFGILPDLSTLGFLVLDALLTNAISLLLILFGNSFASFLLLFEIVIVFLQAIVPLLFDFLDFLVVVFLELEAIFFHLGLDHAVVLLFCHL